MRLRQSGTVGWVLTTPRFSVDKPSEFDRKGDAFVAQFCISAKQRYGGVPRSTSATMSVIVFTKNRSSRSLIILCRARVMVE